MGRQDEIIKERHKKLELLRENGINPYPYSFNKKDSTSTIKEKHAKLKSEEKSGKKAKIAGRVMSIRDMGKIAFIVLNDESGNIQLVLQKGETPADCFDIIKKYVDTGDFIGCDGEIFRTKRGEISILVNKLEILSKSILPLPDKWHGLEDKEERYRKRYLDLIMSPEVREIFIKREKILDSIREFLKKRNFHEIDTPFLQTLYGGAAARPFRTHLNALDIPLFLAVSPELYLKRLIVGGYEKVFTIARNFRNEGIDRWHNPEFTMMEVYQAYADYNDMMSLTEELFEYVAKKVNGSTKINFRGKEVDFKVPWKRITVADSIKENTKLDILTMLDSELKEYCDKNKVGYKGDSWGYYVMALFEHFCEQKIEQPTFVIDHPIESTPLCKLHRKDKSGRLIERFEPFCMGAELANAYSELNDPILQRSLLEEQQFMLSAGNAEANPLDEDFLNAIEVGMPPTGGLGIGIDRMIIFMTGQESIRDIIAFPFMKPLDTKKDFVKEVENNKQQIGKKHTEHKEAKEKKEKKQNTSLPLSREQALNLVKKYNVEKSDLNHYLESEAIMRHLAEKLGEDKEYYGMLGLLHDIDWGLTKKNSKEHLTKAPEILKNNGFDDDFIQIIMSHGYGEHCADLEDKKRDKKIEFALASSETLTGLIHSYALMKGTIEGMEVKGLKKKFSDKKFAAGVKREIISECEKLDLTLDEFFEIGIKAIQSIASEVGLKNG